MPDDLLQEYQQLNSDRPVDLFAFLSSRSNSSSDAKLKVVLHDLKERRKNGKPLKLEEYLERLPDLANDPQAIVALVRTEQQAQFGIDTTPDLSEIAKRFPHLASRLLEQFNTIYSKSPEVPESPVAADPFPTISRDADASDAVILAFGWFQENGGKHVHAPRELRPSVRGLFDMHGNVFEWTHDWFSDYKEGNVDDPMVSDSGTGRVFRGGCWDYYAADCRTAFRYGDDPALRAGNVGFRVALSPSVKSPEAEGNNERSHLA